MKQQKRKKLKRRVSTEVFANRRLIKGASVRSSYCRLGHYMGIIPEKLPNGRLGWPDESIESQ